MMQGNNKQSFNLIQTGATPNNDSMNSKLQARSQAEQQRLSISVVRLGRAHKYGEEGMAGGGGVHTMLLAGLGRQAQAPALTAFRATFSMANGAFLHQCLLMLLNYLFIN